MAHPRSLQMIHTAPQTQKTTRSSIVRWHVEAGSVACIHTQGNNYMGMYGVNQAHKNHIQANKKHNQSAYRLLSVRSLSLTMVMCLCTQQKQQ